MKKQLNDWSRKELLALPQRKWDSISTYDSILVFSTGHKHDSGWACMTVIGVIGGCPKEVITRGSDDIEWKIPGALLRTDCTLKARALHFWAVKGQFVVREALSSIEILTYTKE